MRSHAENRRLGKVFLCEYPYEGEIRLGDTELRELSHRERCETVGYLGHDPELFNDSVENNVLMGEQKKTEDFLKMVCMAEEVNEMDDGLQTLVGMVAYVFRADRENVWLLQELFATKSQFWFWMILFRLWIRAPRDRFLPI